MVEFDPATLIAHYQYLLPFIGYGIGAALKHWTPIPNDSIPYVLAFIGLAAGIFLVGVEPLQTMGWFAGGAVTVHNLVRDAAGQIDRRRGAR